MEKGGESVDLGPETFGELGEAFGNINQSRQALETTILASIGNPDGLMISANALGQHCLVIRDTLFNILINEAEWSNYARANLIAFTLIEDDKKRIDFLRDLAGKDNAFLFNAIYAKHDKVTEEIAEELDSYDDEGLDYDEILDEYISGHTYVAQEKLNKFFGTNFALEQLDKNQREYLKIQAKRESVQDNKEKLKFMAAITVGTAVGSLISKAVWGMATRKRK